MVAPKRKIQKMRQEIEQTRAMRQQNMKKFQECKQAIQQLMLQTKEIYQNQINKQGQEQQIFDKQLAKEIRISSQTSKQDIFDYGRDFNQTFILGFIDSVGEIMLNKLIFPLVNTIFQKIDLKFQNENFIFELTNCCDVMVQKITKNIQQTYTSQFKFYNNIIQQIITSEKTFSAQKIAYIHYRQFEEAFKCAKMQFEQNQEIKNLAKKIDEELQFRKGIQPEEHMNNCFLPIENKKRIETKQIEEQEESQKEAIKCLLSQMEKKPQVVVRRRVIRLI